MSDIFKHVRGKPPGQPRKGPVDVLAEPRAEHDLDAVIAQLTDMGGENVLEITGSFVSARIDVAKLETLEAVAHVTVKAKSQLK